MERIEPKGSPLWGGADWERPFFLDIPRVTDFFFVIGFFIFIGILNQ